MRTNVIGCMCGCHWETVGNCNKCEWWHVKKTSWLRAEGIKDGY